MHPIERLRYVARAGAVPDSILVAETVPGLTGFAQQPGPLLVALRQLIGRQPESPGLLCLGARMLAALDPIDAAWEFVDALELDPTSATADQLAIEEAGGIDLIETIASTNGTLLCPSGSTAWIESARSRGRTVSAITPLGTRLPKLLFRGFIERLGVDDRPGSPELVPLEHVDELITSDGIVEIDRWIADAPEVAELGSFSLRR